MAKADFLDKTLLVIARAGEQTFFSEQSARLPGLLQGLDVRVKILTFLLLLVLISIARTPALLWSSIALCVLLALLSRVPAAPYLRRVLFFGPLLSSIIVFPALFNIITPGEDLWTLFPLPGGGWGPYRLPQHLAVTRQGVAATALMISRVTASVSFAVLLTVTTRWHLLFAGLRALFVPRMFVMTLAMTYRYIFVFLQVIQDMYRARKSRTIHAGPAASERQWVASRIGFLFIRSRELSSDIYLAMVSRGFHGEVRTMDRFRLGAPDILWTAAVVLLGCAGVAWERGMLR